MEFEYRVADSDKEIVRLKRSSLGVPVCYCFDKNYALFTAVSSYSLHANSLIPPRIFWLVPARDFDYCLDLLQSINKFGMDITLIKLGSDHFSGWKGHSTTYYRLLLSNVLDLDKVIYIDSDTIVLDNLSELFGFDVQDSLVAGVVDPGGHTSNIFHYFADSEPYLNAGCLLMNLDLMRRSGFRDICTQVYKKFEAEINYGDQDILNLVAIGRKRVLGQEFCTLMQPNLVTADQFTEIAEKSKIIHFVGEIKPWMQWCNPRAFDFYWSYANKLGIKELTPFPMTDYMHLHRYANTLAISGDTEAAYRVEFHLCNLLLEKLGIVTPQVINS